MIKLFTIDNYYIIFIKTNSNLKIYCSDFIKLWSLTVDTTLISHLINEIFIENNSNKEDIEVKIKLMDENFIDIKVLKIKIDSIKIKLGDFKLPINNDNNISKVMIDSLFEVINYMKENTRTNEKLYEELVKENEKLGEDFKIQTENILVREDNLLNKMCFVLNEKKRKIKELETELFEKSSKKSKLPEKIICADNQVIIVENIENQIKKSPDCHRNLSCSFVHKEIITVGSSTSGSSSSSSSSCHNSNDGNKISKSYSQNSNTPGNNSEDDLFPETINPKLTAVPMKMRVKETIREIHDINMEEKITEVVGGSDKWKNRSIIDNRQTNDLDDNTISNDLFNQM